MANRTKNPHAVALGSKGGKAKGKPKGFAAMPAAVAKRIRAMGIRARALKSLPGPHPKSKLAKLFKMTADKIETQPLNAIASITYKDSAGVEHTLIAGRDFTLDGITPEA